MAQTDTKLQELRDSICREMYETGYDQLSDVSRGIVDKRVEEVRPRTSHDLANSLQQTAEWLLSRPKFQFERTCDARAFVYIRFYEKDAFVAAARAIGKAEKKFTDRDIELRASVPGGSFVIEAPRHLVCRIIKPAEYECDPFLSPEEEQNLGGAA